MSNHQRDLHSYQEEYLRQPFERQQVEFRKRKILELIKKYPHDRLLEIGVGLESIFFRLDSFRQLTIVEPARMFYEKACADAAQAGQLKIEVKNCLLEDLPAGEFDFILASSLLHEITDQDRFIQAIHRHCGPETVVHINVPNANSFHRWLAVKMGLIPSVFQPSAANIKVQQARVFDLKTLRETVERHGFTVLECGSYFFKPFTHSLMQQMLDARLLTPEMVEGFYRMEDLLPELGSEIFVNLRRRG